MVYTQKITQEQLVESAYNLLEREGADALSMRRLAQIVGVRASSLYYHFPEKLMLLQAVAEKGLYFLAAELERASAIAGPEPRRRIQAMGITYREWALQHPQLYRVLFMDTPPIDGISSESSAAACAPVRDVVEILVGVSQAAAATQALWAYVHGFVMLEVTGHMQQCIPAEGFQIGLVCFTQGLGR